MSEETLDRGRIFGERPGAVERIAPGFFEAAFEAEHISRYRWAARRVNGLVLDVACGTGYGAPLLRHHRVSKVVSVDLCVDALRFGAVRYSLAPVLADAACLPFSDDTFDSVVSLETLEHLPDGDAFIAALARILKPGGTVALSTPNVRRTGGKNPYHIREWDLQELTNILGRHGFTTVARFGQHWWLSHPALNHKGLRRLNHEMERRPEVIPKPLPGAEPLYWCVELRKPRREPA